MISRDDRREAESQIARLIHSYFHRLDERDLEAVAAFFEDAAWHISPERATHGKAEKLAWLREHPIGSARTTSSRPRRSTGKGTPRCAAERPTPFLGHGRQSCR
jgi:hypothetical protein